MANTFDINLHKRHLITLLLEICKLLDGKVAFKGGTCAMLFYNLNRFSFDLDFDILETLNREDIDSTKEILFKHGIIKDFFDKHNTIFFLFNYRKDYPNIKVEFNKRTWKHNRYKTVWYMGVRMEIVDEPTLLTNKLIAISDRKSPVARDLFDAYCLLSLKFPISEDLIKERTEKGKQDYIKFLISFIERNYTARNVLQGLGEILGKEQKQWVKKELIEQTLNLLEKAAK